MKKFFTTLAVILGLLIPAVALAQMTTVQGGTGTTSPSGILYGDGTLHLKTVGIGSNLTFIGGILSAITGSSPTFGTTSISATSPLIWNTSTANISIQVANTSQSGFLSSTDWNTFNGKQAAGNYLTALTGDGTASGPGSASFTLTTVNSNIGTFNNLTVNAKGLVTAASNIVYDTFGYLFPSNATTTNITFNGGLTGNLTGNASTATALQTGRTISITGDLAYISPAFDGSGNVTAAGTLATVNSNVGSFTNANITVNGKGLITAASNGTTADTFAWPFTPVSYGNATGTLIGFTGGILSVGSTTIVGNATTTGMHAFGNVRIPTLGVAAGQFAAFDPNGVLIGTTTPTNTGGSSEGVQWATAAVLGGTPTYSNGTAGVGATLTEVGTGALAVDGNSPASGDRVLVKNQASAFQNGIYTVTVTGSGIASYVLTRSSDYNSNTEITPGLTTYVVNGSANLDTNWAVNFTVPLTMGTTNLNYTKVSGGGAAVTSVSNSDSTLTITPTTGNVIASLNLGNANVWSALQTFGNATSSLFSSTYASSTNAFFGTLNLPLLTGTQCLHEISGVVSGTGSDCGSGGGSLTGTTGQTAYFSGTNTAIGTSSLFIGTNGQLINKNGNVLTIDASYTVSTSTFTGDFTDVQSAINALPSTGGTITVKCGTYTLPTGNVGIQFKVSNTVIQGDGNCTQFNFDKANTTNAVEGATSDLENIVLKNFYIHQTNATFGGIGINASNTPLFTVQNLKIDGTATSVQVKDTKNLSFYQNYTNLDLRGNTSCIELNGLPVNNNTFTNTRCALQSGNNGFAYYLDSSSVNGAQANTFIGANSEPTGAATGLTAIYANNAVDDIFIDPYMEGNAVAWNFGANSQRDQIQGGEFISNTTYTNNGSNNQFLGVDKESQAYNLIEASSTIQDVSGNDATVNDLSFRGNGNFAKTGNQIDMVFNNSTDSGNNINIVNPGTGAGIRILATGKTAATSTGKIFIHGLTTSTAGNALCVLATTGEVVNAGANACSTSSKYTKHDITGIAASTVQEVMQLQPVQYVYNDSGEASYGFVAEDVQKIDPKLVDHASATTTLDGHVFNTGDPISINYSQYTGLLTAFVQFQQNEIEALQPAAHSAEDNWQWVAIVLLVGWNFYLTLKRRD